MNINITRHNLLAALIDNHVHHGNELGIDVRRITWKRVVDLNDLMVALDRRIPDNVERLRAGRWDKKTFSEARGLHGRTLGILGLGAIGREVARRPGAMPTASNPNARASCLIDSVSVRDIMNMVQGSIVSFLAAIRVTA